MSKIIERGNELYAALDAGDADTLKRLLTTNFQGHLTAGLPHGFGRTYDGLDAMLNEGWGAVGEWFEMSPHPKQLFDGGDVLIGLGEYVGSAKATGEPVRAAFAHFWRFDGDRFTGVEQVTDSGLWRDALLGDQSASEQS